MKRFIWNKTLFLWAVCILLALPVQAHKITVQSSAGGTPTTYEIDDGATLHLVATADAGSRFVRWQDGDNTNPRDVTVTCDASYTAVFEAISGGALPQKHTATIYGGGCGSPYVGEFTTGSTLDIIAVPQEGYRFKRWSDGDDTNPRTLAITSDVTLFAEFEQYSINSTTSLFAVNIQTDGCENIIEGRYPAGTELTLIAQPNTEECTLFKQWDNASVEPVRVVTVTENATYTAYFGKEQYTVQFLNYDNTELQSGQVDCGIVPTYTGETPTKPADALHTYTFAGWSPDVVAATGDATYTARFEAALLDNIILQENESSDYYTQFAQDYNGQRVTTATLNRQFTQGKWATLCLPFNVNKAMMMSLGLYNRVFAFRYAQQLDDETIQVFFVPAQSIEAGKGYIVNPNAKLAAKTSFVFPNVTINTDSDNGDITTLTGYNDGTGRGNLFLVGTLRTGILQGSTTGNTYLGLKDNQLYYPNSTSGTLMRAYRAVFRSGTPVNASRVRIIADGESVTELEVIGDEQERMDNGQLQNNATPARKYIDNGILYLERNGITYTAQGHRLE